MTPGYLSNFEQEICKKLIISQISSAIDTLNYLRTELKGDHQFSDEEILGLTVALVFINKCF